MVNALPDVRCCLTLPAALCSEVTSFISTFTAGNGGSARVRDWLNPTQPVDISSRRSGLEVSGSQIFCCRLLGFTRKNSFLHKYITTRICMVLSSENMFTNILSISTATLSPFYGGGSWGSKRYSTCPWTLEVIA